MQSWKETFDQCAENRRLLRVGPLSKSEYAMRHLREGFLYLLTKRLLTKANRWKLKPGMRSEKEPPQTS